MRHTSVRTVKPLYGCSAVAVSSGILAFVLLWIPNWPEERTINTTFVSFLLYIVYFKDLLTVKDDACFVN